MLLYTATAKRALTARIRTPSAMRPRLRASACPRGGGTAPSSRRRASGLAGRVIVVMIRLRSLVQRLDLGHRDGDRSEEHTSELPSLMRNSYAVFCSTTKN